MSANDTIFVFGEAKYRDAFNEPRYTKFRFVANGQDGWPPVSQLLVCDEGNEAN
jgi:hypothetical protein